MPQTIPTGTFGVAKWVVSADATQGTHTTIGAALTSASSGDTIYIRTGTYTENPTLKAGVNLCALPSESGLNGNADAVANVIIIGTCTLTTAGTVTICGVQLQTNSSFFLTVSGSAASIVNLVDCYLNCLNNTGISFTTSSSSAQVNIWSCAGNIALTTITLASCTSPGTFQISYSDIESNVVTTTASTFNTTTLNLEWSLLKFPITLTAASASSNYTQVNCSVTAFTTVTSGNTVLTQSQFIGTTQPAISIGTGTTITILNCVISSSNTDAITGAGTLNQIGTVFSGTSSLSNVTTQTGVGLPIANGVSGTVLTSNGAGTIPTFQAASGSTAGKVTAQKFTSTGSFTYTPTANMVTCIIDLVGAGAGSGGIASASGVSSTSSGGGGGGSYLKIYATSAQIGASATGSVGTGGTAGSAGNNNGGDGGNTTITINSGTAWTASGGSHSNGTASGSSTAGGAANANTTGTNATLMVNITGQNGSTAYGNAAVSNTAFGGNGGNSGGGFGNGGYGGLVLTTGTSAGASGSGFGAGGGGSGGWNSATNVAGAAGTNGFCVITEFLSG